MSVEALKQANDDGTVDGVSSVWHGRDYEVSASVGGYVYTATSPSEDEAAKQVLAAVRKDAAARDRAKAERAKDAEKSARSAPPPQKP